MFITAGPIRPLRWRSEWLNERNVDIFGKRLLSGDDTVLTAMYGSRQHYSFVSAASAVGANIN